MKEQFTVELSSELCKVLDALVAKYGSDRSGFIEDALYEYYSDERREIKNDEKMNL